MLIFGHLAPSGVVSPTQRLPTVHGQPDLCEGAFGSSDNIGLVIVEVNPRPILDHFLIPFKVSVNLSVEIKALAGNSRRSL